MLLVTGKVSYESWTNLDSRLFLTGLTIFISIKIWMLFHWYIRSLKWLFNSEKTKVCCRGYFLVTFVLCHLLPIQLLTWYLISTLHSLQPWDSFSDVKLTYVKLILFSFLCPPSIRPKSTQFKGKKANKWQRKYINWNFTPEYLSKNYSFDEQMFFGSRNVDICKGRPYENAPI